LLLAWSNWSLPIFPTESFIAHTADLSALGGCDDVRINLLLCIIAPTADYVLSKIKMDYRRSSCSAQTDFIIGIIF